MKDRKILVVGGLENEEEILKEIAKKCAENNLSVVVIEGDKKLH